MPAKSKAQQRFFGMVHAYQKGELDNPSKAIKDAAKSISKKGAKEFAETKHKGLPNHVKKSKKKANESIKITQKMLENTIAECVRRVLREMEGEEPVGFSDDNDFSEELYTIEMMFYHKDDGKVYSSMGYNLGGDRDDAASKTPDEARTGILQWLRSEDFVQNHKYDEEDGLVPVFYVGVTGDSDVDVDGTCYISKLDSEFANDIGQQLSKTVKII